jgi:hypothetical protein
VNNVRHDVGRHFRNKKREYLKDKINENKDIRGLCREINEFKRGYKPRNNLVTDKNDDLIADSSNILTGEMSVMFGR